MDVPRPKRYISSGPDPERRAEILPGRAHDAEFGLTQWPGLIGKLHGQISGGSSARNFVGQFVGYILCEIPCHFFFHMLEGDFPKSEQEPQ